MKVLMLVLYMVSITHAIIGYDCGSKNMNVTTISLLDVGECEIPEEKINITQKYIQLLQINEYSETEVIQCKIEIRRTVFHCGMFSHVSLVHNGESEYIIETSQQNCKDMHRTGVLKFNNEHVIHGLEVNQTNIHSLTFAGWTNSDGKCKGSTYADFYGSWEDVVVQGVLKITLTVHTATVNLNDNKLRLKSGTTCLVSDSTCMDMEGGSTFWEPVPIDNCKFQQFGVLFEGYANKIIDSEVEGSQTVFSLTTNDITFALTAKAKINVCGYVIARTEHPKLLIFETSKGETFAPYKKVSVSNLDIFAYVNSKFVFVEKHIRTQIKQLYRDVIIQRCNIERQTLRNTLTIATQTPDEFAYNLMKGPGYMAVLAGEVVHIIKCIPVEVKIEHGESCYTELQVTRKNVTLFMTPRTHILKTKGTQINCNRLIPSYYYVNNEWYKILPLPTEGHAPTILKPLTRPTWRYINPADLATNGIYSEKELHQLRERIMFPVERQSLLNNVAREMNGQPLADDEGTISKLLNEEAVNKIAQGAWDRLWSKFITFGTASAGVIAIMMILHIVKIIVDIIIRGYTLHSVFGWSTHVLGAIWGSVAHLLIHLSQAQTTVPLDKELESVNTSMPSNISSTAPKAEDVVETTIELPKPTARENEGSTNYFSLYPQV